VRESIEQYLKSLGYWGFLVAALLVGDIYGIVQSYLTTPSENFVLPVWGWWLILVVILIVSPFLAFHTLRLRLVSVEGDLRDLQESSPSINIERVERFAPGGGTNYYLKVHNSGAVGVFKAQLELSSEEPSVGALPRYIGCWEDGNKGEARILKGQDDLLKIATAISSLRPYYSIHLEIPFYDPKANYVHSVSTSSYWADAVVTSKDGNVRPMTKWDYKLRVTISSSPELRDGVFCKDYVLNVDGLTEV
jgi:hypothetical protein